MGTTTVDGEFPRTVKHFRGETTIKSAPSKVVILSTGQLDGVLSPGRRAPSARQPQATPTWSPPT